MRVGVLAVIIDMAAMKITCAEQKQGIKQSKISIVHTFIHTVKSTSSQPECVGADASQ